MLCYLFTFLCYYYWVFPTFSSKMQIYPTFSSQIPLSVQGRFFFPLSVQIWLFFPLSVLDLKFYPTFSSQIPLSVQGRFFFPLSVQFCNSIPLSVLDATQCVFFAMRPLILFEVSKFLSKNGGLEREDRERGEREARSIARNYMVIHKLLN